METLRKMVALSQLTSIILRADAFLHIVVYRHYRRLKQHALFYIP